MLWSDHSGWSKGDVMKRMCAVALLAVAMSPAAFGQNVVKQEPGPGLLGCGATVLVDDGTCGKGKIKQVTGGCNMNAAASSSGAGAGRQRKCVSR
jgi:hypothetical protein